jgi:homoserine dehydrogenase
MKPVRIGLLGCGTVGGGVLQILRTKGEQVVQSVGAPLEVARVLVRDQDKTRVPELDRSKLTTDPEAVLGDPSIDIFVEVMGGVDPTRGFVERAIDSKRSVVSANKMLLAMHGPELIERAIAANVDLAFEASVGGGIPIIRVLREALASDSVVQIEGIVNGTCNYMLTRMRSEGLSFDAALREAQAKGYAEADPGLDVDGHDAAHKLVVLAMLAFGGRVDSERVPTEGIRGIDPIDHRFAERFGFVIKHLAIGRERGESVELHVHPALVLSDVLEVARARICGVSGMATRSINTRPRAVASMDDLRSSYYLRFQVHDRPGVLARLAGALGDAGVSIEQMVQEGAGDASPVEIVMLTHEATERDVRRALEVIAKSEVAAAAPRMIRVQE